MQTVKGEVQLFDKLMSYLDIAEEWFSHTFTSGYMLNTIASYDDGNIIRTYSAKVIVGEAFKNAIPSLDLILTPNGFGIVNNSNIAPASGERVNRLIDSLEAERDNAIRLLLSALAEDTEWKQTTQYGFFAATMFPNIDICDFLGIRNHKWQKYLYLLNYEKT